MDDYAWGVLIQAIAHTEVEAVIITPPSGTYRDTSDGLMPALRGEGPLRTGLPAAADFKHLLRQEDLLWLRTAKLLADLCRRRKPWICAI